MSAILASNIESTQTNSISITYLQEIQYNKHVLFSHIDISTIPHEACP